MHNKKFCLIVWLCLVFLIAKSADAIVINEIMYSPDGTDTGHEWIELYNNEALDVDISEWKLYENNINHGLTLIQGDMIIPKDEYAIIVDKNDSFLLDYPGFNGTLIDSAFSLNNTGEFICIKNNSALVDCVDYSSSWGADGNGKTLEKIDPNKGNTKDNWNESRVNGGTPGMKNSVNDNADSDIIPLYVNVIGSIPSVNSINISPDCYSTQGFQVMPNAGKNKEITISAVIGDDDSIDDIISVIATINNNEIELLKKETISEYEAIYEGKTNMSFYDAPGTYTADVKAVDNSSLEQINTTEFNYLELLAVDISSGQINFGSLITGINNTLTGDNGSTICNIGNIISNIEISGTNLSNGNEIIGINNLYYEFGTSSFKPLSISPLIADINLGYGESSCTNMNLKLYIPTGTEKGDYTGSITMTAIAN